ncbi:BlaI/MecI/CopY family transcriptional regulator [Clostridium grantii]|uniref:BlaI family transcriptional regulator, penicillinase repressor n=1 Tax=Clostridium grantii DSM 8605 TaxID=1121316 RepID=A0A1M5TML6_9CLOT|nr:BlaI/MecI/CopY family transcriptional regulator [Clostridium grantii]SHH51928.1 BlaI family transcriptional regulator, penicillinase repressor [Clostridium grantii DSM 8605]
MNELPKISDAEWQIMRVLWQKYPLTSTEIIENLRESTTWNPKTVHTLISRLVKKEAVEVVKTASINQFFPLVTKEECRRVETKSFIKKVYDGSIKLLVMNFIKDEKLSYDEIQELKQILDHKISEKE